MSCIIHCTAYMGGCVLGIYLWFEWYKGVYKASIRNNKPGVTVGG